MGNTSEDVRDKNGNDELKLFLSTNKPYRSVSSQTISSWLVTIFKHA